MKLSLDKVHYSEMGGRISPKNLTGRAREVMGLKENEDAVIYDNFFEDQTLDDIERTC